MPALPTLVLLGEPQPNLGMVELEPTISGVTGNPRRRLQVEISGSGQAMEDALQDELRQAAKTPVEKPLADTGGGAWHVTGRYSTSTAGSQRFTFTVEIEEHRPFNLEAVEFGGIAAAVDRFEISDEGKGFTCTVLLTLDKSQTTAFEAFYVEAHRPDTFFPVRLVGVTDNAIEMRFGSTYWGRLDHDRTRRVFTLVSRAFDERDESDRNPLGLSMLIEPALSRLKERTVYASRALDALIAELRDIGVIDDNAVSRIKAHAEERVWADFKEFTRADKVEDFFH